MKTSLDPKKALASKSATTPYEHKQRRPQIITASRFGLLQTTSLFMIALTVGILGVQLLPPSHADHVTPNRNATVKTTDSTTIIKNWGKTVPKGTDGDLNDDGTVNTLDITILVKNWPKNK